MAIATDAKVTVIVSSVSEGCILIQAMSACKHTDLNGIG